MNKLKELRFQKKKTQLEIAKSIGITQQNLSHIENGIVTPSLKVAKRISDYFGSTVDDIFFDNEHNLKMDTVQEIKQKQ